MLDFFAQLAFVIATLSPIFAYRAGFKKIGRVNLMTVIAFLVVWVCVISTGPAYNSPISLLFYTLIYVNLFFVLGNSILFLRHRDPRIDMKQLIALTGVLTLLCFVFIESVYPTNVVSDTLLQTLLLAVPIFTCGVILTRLRQIDREPEHT